MLNRSLLICGTLQYCSDDTSLTAVLVVTGPLLSLLTLVIYDSKFHCVKVKQFMQFKFKFKTIIQKCLCIRHNMRIKIPEYKFGLGVDFQCAYLPRPIPVQRYRKGSHPGSHHCAGHCNLQTGVPHRHSSKDGSRAKQELSISICDRRTGSRGQKE